MRYWKCAIIRAVALLNVVAIALLAGCKNDSFEDIDCNGLGAPISDFQDSNGNRIQIFDNGAAYTIDNGSCTFAAQYFTPGFYDENYIDTDSGTFALIDGSILFDPFTSFDEPFEGFDNALDLLIKDASQRNRLFTQFTLQSPSAPDVSAYQALQACIIAGTCDFIDNRIDLIADPEDSENTVLRFYSVAPTANMVTAKCSMSSSLVMRQKGADFWYEAKYYLEQGRPTTLVDFESSYFLGSPGPRLIFRGDQLAIENKFMEKLNYLQTTGEEIDFPMNQWVTVKIHLQFDEADGIIQVWQDGQQIIDAVGKNIPLDIWVLNSLEIGISATSEETTIYVDDVRFSDQPL